MRRLDFLAIALMTLVCLTASARVHALQVVSVSPSQNAVNVPVTANVTIHFDTDINPATLNASTIIVLMFA